MCRSWLVTDVPWADFQFFHINIFNLLDQDWDRQNPTQIVTEMCGFVTILSGTFLLHKTKDMSDGMFCYIAPSSPGPYLVSCYLCPSFPGPYLVSCYLCWLPTLYYRSITVSIYSSLKAREHWWLWSWRDSSEEPGAHAVTIVISSSLHPLLIIHPLFWGFIESTQYLTYILHSNFGQKGGFFGCQNEAAPKSPGGEVGKYMRRAHQVHTVIC